MRSAGNICRSRRDVSLDFPQAREAHPVEKEALINATLRGDLNPFGDPFLHIRAVGANERKFRQAFEARHGSPCTLMAAIPLEGQSPRRMQAMDASDRVPHDAGALFSHSVFEATTANPSRGS